MALIDVKKYYIKTLLQYVEVKENLKDFEQALKDGYITEDKLQAEVEDVEKIKENVDRLAYILYLFNLPKRKEKKVKYKKANEDLETYFKELKADEESVLDENTNLLTDIKRSLSELLDKKQ